MADQGSLSASRLAVDWGEGEGDTPDVNCVWLIVGLENARSDACRSFLMPVIGHD